MSSWNHYLRPEAGLEEADRYNDGNQVCVYVCVWEGLKNWLWMTDSLAIHKNNFFCYNLLVYIMYLC